jgi:membrane fusion protein (multidrug efflux system)
MAKSKGNGKRWAIVVFGCMALLLTLAAIKYWQINRSIAFAESFPERSEAVTAVTATTSEWQQYYTTIGDIKSTQYVELRNEVEGVVTQLGVIGGDSVSKGQLLVQLDDSEERAQLRATRAQLKLAELQVQRNAELRTSNLVSKNDYDQAVANRDVLAANAAALQDRISKKHLQAPFDAHAGLHDLQVGQYLAPNTLITVLIGVADKVWVDFNLPQEHAAIPIGSVVRIYRQGRSDSALQATVISADATISSSSRNRRFRAELLDPPDTIMPGAVVTVEVADVTPHTVFRLPADAVRRNNFGTFVYILRPAESGADAAYRAHRQKVEYVATEADTILVTSGLTAGDRVAATGAFKLQDGMLANVQESANTSVPQDQP